MAASGCDGESEPPTPSAGLKQFLEQLREGLYNRHDGGTSKTNIEAPRLLNFSQETKSEWLRHQERKWQPVDLKEAAWSAASFAADGPALQQPGRARRARDGPQSKSARRKGRRQAGSPTTTSKHNQWAEFNQMVSYCAGCGTNIRQHSRVHTEESASLAMSSRRENCWVTLVPRVTSPITPGISAAVFCHRVAQLVVLK